MNRKAGKTIVLLTMIFLIFWNRIYGVNSAEEIPITPIDEFFIVATDFFDIDPESYRLVVIGEVYNPLNLSLADVKEMPVTSEIVRLTCFDYTFGATSLTGVANWTGVRLSHILDLAEINFDKAKDISFHTEEKDGYSTSLSLEEAYWEDVILAYEMNEETLPKWHGFPIRLVCPRFYGYKWIKWLVTINVTSENYLGYYERIGYPDAPYVDISLPIYYYPPTTIGTSTSNQKTTDWPVLESFFSFLLIIPIIRTIWTYNNKKLK